MSAFRNIDVRAPHVQQLQQTIQHELARRTYSSDDDPVMAEYIVVMLANQKTPDQVTSELNELIGAEYDPAFTDWIWSQTQTCLDHADRADQAHQLDQAERTDQVADATTSTNNNTDARRQEATYRRSRSPEAAGSSRQRMGRERRSRSPPPAYSRYTHDARVRDDRAFDGESYWRRKADERRRQPRPPVLREGGPRHVFDAAVDALRQPGAGGPPNAQKELFPTTSAVEPAAGTSIFGRAGIPDPRAPAFVPSTEASATAPAEEAASIFARIDPMVPVNEPPPATAVAQSTEFPSEPSETALCRWNVGCTNPVCAYSHASPANAAPGGDPDALVLSQQSCRFGARCTNKDCTRSHVSPAVAKLQARSLPATVSVPMAGAREKASAGGVLSMDAALPSQTASRPCRFGAACTRPDCFFAHPESKVGGTPCRFGLGCTRKDCYFTHPQGQRASDAPLTGTVNRLHVFAHETQDEDMERIIPGAPEHPQPLLSS